MSGSEELLSTLAAMQSSGLLQSMQVLGHKKMASALPGALQTGQQPYPDERTAPGDDLSVHTVVQATGICSASGQGMISWDGCLNLRVWW